MVLSSVSMAGGAEINNALELDATRLDAWQPVRSAIEGSAGIREVIEAVYGVSTFELAETKLLEASPHAPPHLTSHHSLPLYLPARSSPR